MTQVNNPLDHFSTRYLKRHLRKSFNKMNRIAQGRTTKGDYEQLRVTVLTINDSLTRRKVAEELEKMLAESTEEENELDFIPN